MAIQCGHSTAVVPNPLPDATTAALAHRVDPGDPAETRRLAMMIIWTLWAARFQHGGVDFRGVDNAAVCAVLHRHPDLVAHQARGNIRLLCMIARRIDNPTWLPARTELGLAQRIAAVHGADLAHTPEMGGWLVYDGKRWVVDGAGTAAVGRVVDVVTDLVDTEAYYGDEDEQARGRAFAMRAQQAKFIKAGLDLARAQIGINVPAADWDSKTHLLPAANGTLELSAGEAKLREHRRDDRLTRVARAAYRPHADASVWERFCADVMPDPAVRQRVQRLVGYSLMGGNPERLLIILIGRSTTGKSTFVETVGHVLGEFGGTFDLGLFRGSREGGAPRADLLAALPRRLIHTTEASDRWELHADQIKRLTGGDTLTARGLYARTAVEARPAFTPWVATNAAPRVIGADDALWRRLEVIPFDTKISREDAGLAARLRQDEADAVLAWAVQGWMEYGRHGLGAAPPACTAAARQLRSDLSLVDTWLDETTEADPGSTVAAAVLAESFHDWCIANRVPERERISSVALGRALTVRGHALATTGPKDARVRVRTGLRLRDPGTVSRDLRAVL